MRAQMGLTDKIVAADLCTGCGACAALAPNKVEMMPSVDGFPRPQAQKLNRKLAGKIKAVCPGSGQQGETAAPLAHPLWGGYHQVAQGWASDETLRFAAASGGALSAVLIAMLESEQVDGVVQVQADPNDPTGNKTVISRSPTEVMASVASRYAPSMPLLEVPRLLDQERRHAFVGKPCDVAALREWAKIDARVDDVFPVMISFFCAGVPSEKGALEIVEKLGVEPQDVSAFRYRGNGWPGRAEVIDRHGERRSMSYQKSWGNVLSRHVQPRCRICADGAGQAADIAFGDAWQTDENGYPLFEERAGASLILARTKKGADLLANAVTAEKLRMEPLSPGQIEAMQPGQARRRRELLGRLAGRILSGMPIPQYRGLGIWACARMTPIGQTIKAALGMARRCMMRRQKRNDLLTTSEPS